MNRFHRWACRSAWWKGTVEKKLLPWALKGIDLGGDLLEVGPGPGLTTDILRQRAPHLTALEIDPRLADSLKARLHGTNVTVVEGDATRMPFEGGSFSAAVSFTMLHHVPSASLQDRLLSEVCRVLRPGGIFVGTDSLWSRTFQLMHLFDTMVMVEPDSLATRLTAAGFGDVSVKRGEGTFCFRARRPLA